MTMRVGVIFVVSAWFCMSASVYAARPPEKYTLEQVERATQKMDGFTFGSQCYQQLKRYGCDTGNIECTPKISGAAQGAEGGGLNPEFACRLVKYFQAHPEQRIISAYRSAAKQRGMCGGGKTGCAAAGKSCHQYGLAVDVSGLKLAVKQTDPSGVIRAYSGSHLQCKENPTASCSKDTVPCSGQFRDDPRNAQQSGGGQSSSPQSGPSQSGGQSPQGSIGGGGSSGGGDGGHDSGGDGPGEIEALKKHEAEIAKEKKLFDSCADYATCVCRVGDTACKERKEMLLERDGNKRPVYNVPPPPRAQKVVPKKPAHKDSSGNYSPNKVQINEY